MKSLWNIIIILYARSAFKDRTKVILKLKNLFCCPWDYTITCLISVFTLSPEDRCREHLASPPLKEFKFQSIRVILNDTNESKQHAQRN